MGLTWAGWNEYQKLAAYEKWAKGFQKAKYDIYAVMGYQNSQITWGKPCRQGPTNLQTFSMRQVQAIDVLVDGQAIDLQVPPSRAKMVYLQFQLVDTPHLTSIPFTEIPLATQWGQYLRQELTRLSLEKSI
jgi:hypothetical protein